MITHQEAYIRGYIVYRIQSRAIPVQVKCDDSFGGPFGQGLAQVSSRVTNALGNLLPDPDRGERFLENSSDPPCDRPFIWPQPRNVNASESHSPRFSRSSQKVDDSLSIVPDAV